MRPFIFTRLVGAFSTVVCLAVCLQPAGLQAMDSNTSTAVGSEARSQPAKALPSPQDDATAVPLAPACLVQPRTGTECAEALVIRGIALHRADRNTEAKCTLEEALREPADSPRSRAVRVVASGLLASVYRNLGDYQGAENLLRNTIANPIASNQELATMMINLADLLREQARLSEAREILADAGRLTDLPWRWKTDVLVETAEVDRDLRLWDESISLWNEAEQLAHSHDSTKFDAILAGGLGETWFAAGNDARAEPLLRRALKLLREDPTSSLPQHATALAVLARLYMEENKLATAGEFLDEAIGKDESSLGPDHPQVGVLLELRAEMLSRRGDAQSAREDLARAQTIMSSHFGPESQQVGGVLAALGEVEQRAHQPAAAATQYGRAMKLFREGGADSTRYVAAILTRYAVALKDAHKPAEAKALLRSFAAVKKRTGEALTNEQGFREK
jgi:tetratricopeptide (TPR) repeat protein